MEKIFFIVNPRSANGSTRTWWPSVLPDLDKAGFIYDWSFTTGPYQAPSLAAAAIKKGYRTIVSVGGDGTVYEVLNGILVNQRLRHQNTVLGVWPRGTGSDLARTIGLPREKDAMINMLQHGKAAAIDAGECTFFNYCGEKVSRYFLNVAEAGLGGETVARVNRTTKVFGGFLSFLWGALVSALIYQNRYMRIILDENEIVEGMHVLVACGNGRFFGGGMEICPQAIINDGYLDVIAIREIGKLELLLNLPLVYRGTHLNHPKIWHRRVKKVVVQSDQKTLVNLDGEQPGIVEAEFRVLPGVVNLLLPNQDFS